MIKIQTSAEFSKAVMELADSTDLNYLEAILHEAKRKNIELEIIPKLLTHNLKAKLEDESYDMNRLGKKPSRLPFKE